MRYLAIIGLLASSVASTGVLWGASPTTVPQEPVLTTGITGSAIGSGLEDPQYVLSFPQVQALILAVAHAPMAGDEIETRLSSTPVTSEVLVGLGLLKMEGRHFRLGYSVLTKEDQETIYSVSRSLGADLADQFTAHKSELDRLLAAYPFPKLRPQLAFSLIAGMVLNWEGLRSATHLGFRVDPDNLPGGRPYLVHSEEIGANTPTEGFYWGSHTFPGPTMSLSTFGDGPSIPRTKGLPDALSEPIEKGLTIFDEDPSLRGTAQNAFMPHLIEMLIDAGRIMQSVAAGPASKEELSQQSTVPSERMTTTLDLLVAIDYLELDGGKYVPKVPVLTTRDKHLVDGVLALGARILTAWMQAHYQPLKTRLRELTPIRSGLPYEVVFNEIWHYTFGWTTKALAERGFYQNPRAAEYPHTGYVPLVWASSLYAPEP